MARRRRKKALSDAGRLAQSAGNFVAGLFGMSLAGDIAEVLVKRKLQKFLPESAPVAPRQEKQTVIPVTAGIDYLPPPARKRK